MSMLQFWNISFVLFGVLLLPLVHCSDPNSQVKDDLGHNNVVVASNNATTNQQNVEANSGSGSGSGSASGAPLKKDEQEKTPKEVVQNDLLKSKVNNTLEDSKDGTGKGKVPGDSSNVGVMKKDKESDSVGSSKERIDSKQETTKDDKESSNTRGSEQRGDFKQVISKDKESGNTGGSNGDKSKQVSNAGKESDSSTRVSEKNLRDDGCDPSNMCIDEKKMLMACWRIPGNDSPDILLQIWNKGRKPVTVSITAPAFVQLEESKVQLQPKEDKKVKVSMAYDGKDSLIFLTTEDSRCSLDFREFIPDEARADPGYGFNLRYHLSRWTRTHFIIFLVLTSFLVFGCAWMYFGLCKKLAPKSGYQPVEMELPVSDVAKTTVAAAAVLETDSGGWDNSWDDSWDDEEAPMTPTLPTTPSVSSRGLASRRLTKGKEGWKD